MSLRSFRSSADKGSSSSSTFGCGASADFYQLQWFDPLAPGGGAWKELPAGSMGGFKRQYFGPERPAAGPIATHPAKFPVQPVDGRLVLTVGSLWYLALIAVGVGTLRTQKAVGRARHARAEHEEQIRRLAR